MKHQKWIKNYEEDFEKLATEIGDLRYDSLELFLTLLSDKIKRDALKDAERKRGKLAKSLDLCSQNLRKASENIDESWRISNLLKLILKELSYPKLCDEIEVSINNDCVEKRKLVYKKAYENHLNWLDVDIEAWDNYSKKWQAEIISVVSECNKENGKIKFYV